MFDPVTIFVVATAVVKAVDRYTETEARRKRAVKLSRRNRKVQVINVPMEVGDQRQAKRFQNSTGFNDFKDMVRRGRYIRDGQEAQG